MVVNGGRCAVIAGRQCMEAVNGSVREQHQNGAEVVAGVIRRARRNGGWVAGGGEGNEREPSRKTGVVPEARSRIKEREGGGKA